MDRPIKLGITGLIAALALLVSSCGGGGGAAANPPAPPPTPVAGQLPTATPLQQVPTRNQVTQSTAAGSITLRVENIVLVGGQTTHFSVFLFDGAGKPFPAGQKISVTSNATGLTVVSLDLAGTRADGSFNGEIIAHESGGSITASFENLSVTLTVVAFVTPIIPPTFTPTSTPPPPPTPTATATVTRPTATATATATATPQPGGIQFVSAVPMAIGVQGSGLQTFSILTFLVTDKPGSPLAGVQVNFSLALPPATPTPQVADVSLSATQGTTDDNGNVQVTLHSGASVLAVEVVAQVDGVSPPLLVHSTVVSIISGTQSHISVAHQFHNISGRVSFGLTDTTTAYVVDNAGLPVAGTAVIFTTTGGSIGHQLQTGQLGDAIATLQSSAPIPPNGIASTLATTVGARPYKDKNGNGVCDDGVDTVYEVSEPYYDSNCNGQYDPGEQFSDINHNGIFDADQGTGLCADEVVLFASICTVFSGTTTTHLTPPDHDASLTVLAGGSVPFVLTVSDDLNNPIVGGSTVSITVQGSRAKVLGVSNFTIPDQLPKEPNTIELGLSQFLFSIADNAPTSATGETDAIVITITSAGLPAGGNGSKTLSRSITFLGAPTPTVVLSSTPTLVPTPTPTSPPIDTPTVPPTLTITPTFTPTPTPTIQPPSIVPGGATLFAGVETPPSCNGISQTFAVNGGAPPFTISAGGVGCLDTALVSVSGGSFTFTTGNEVGTFLITATDALGRIATAALTQQGPPAAFIDVDLFENVRSDNGDGSFSSVATALVTDANGATVADGVPVEFSLVNPVSGVSITSPGLTNQQQPCTVSFPVVKQSGDALACIKYLSSRQGSTITIRARVTTATGAIIEAVRIVTLPDTRPTPTLTTTPTLMASSTPTITLTPTPFPTGQATFTPTITPLVTPTAPVGSIAFISAQPATIGVRASGLPEQAVVTFQAKDTQARPIAGAPVTFLLTGSGSELLNPTAAITDANGMVTTTVTSGFRATTVRITAEADSNGDGIPDIFVNSQVVGIVGAPPAFNHFSLAPARLNIAGRVTFGLEDQVSVYVNDRFGNAVPPQTSVSFITNAASIVNPTVTNSSGIATATLLSEGLVPPSGIVTVLAFTRGEESFLDNNGNGKFDCFPESNPPCHSSIDSLGPNNELDDNPEPRIDFRPLPSSLEPDPAKNDSSCPVAPPSELCNDKFDSNKPFELFVDSNGNGLFDSPPPNATGNGFGQGTDGEWDNNIFVWGSVPVTFSGHLVTPVAAPTFFSIPQGGSQAFTLEVHDDLLNPLVGGSTITVASAVGNVSGGTITVPDGESFNQIVDGLTRFSFVLSAADTGPLVSTSIVVTVTSQNGTGTFVVATGLIPGKTAAAPTPTP